MILAVRCPIVHGASFLERSCTRYDLLRRVASSSASRDITLLAFGLADDELRLLVEGDDDPIRRMLRGVKGGTSRAARCAGKALIWGPSEREVVEADRLAGGVAWCHRAPGDRDPLLSPWTSHRDLLGFRHASFYDPAVLRGRASPLEIHALAGGGELPRLNEEAEDADLAELLRVAAAVVGVQPANRRCFRLFVHAARACGFATADLARALMLTGRRIRQLAQAEEPLLDVALTHLADPRLARVP